MSPQLQDKRQQLKDLSRVAKALVTQGAADGINDALVMIYQKQGHTEIHSFKQWLSLGFVVKRGEKALLLWGQPLKAAKQEKKEVDSDKDEFSFFPLAFVFSNLQVEQLKK